MPIDYDDRAWPLVVITAPDEEASEAVFAEHLRRIEQYHQRGGRFLMLVDVRRAPPMQPTHRRELGEKLAELSQRYPDRLAGMAMVVSSQVQRGILTAVGWVVRPAYPMRVFVDAGAARSWLESELGVERSLGS